MREELHELEETVEHENLHINRFIKNEVIEMAETVDEINDTMLEYENDIKFIKDVLINQNKSSSKKGGGQVRESSKDSIVMAIYSDDAEDGDINQNNANNTSQKQEQQITRSSEGVQEQKQEILDTEKKQKEPNLQIFRLKESENEMLNNNEKVEKMSELE